MSSSSSSSSSNPIKPMDPDRLYQYLKLQTFSNEELAQVFQAIRAYRDDDDDLASSNGAPAAANPNNSMICEPQVASFLLDRIEEIEQDLLDKNQFIRTGNRNSNEEERRLYAKQQAEEFMLVFPGHENQNLNDASSHYNSDSDNHKIPTTSITQEQFVTTITDIATTVDMKRMWPITLSILLVGTSVGIVTPAMPFVVEQIGLTPGQYGTVVSAFALAKMAGNIPSAILVERHGRKPYLTFSLAVIALGVGGIGAATTFEQLYACRLFTGAGVAALTTASQLMVTDVSTPLNRATTMSPIVSGFAAGTALGPAIGGTLVDQMGLQATFYMVGASYLGVAFLNRAILDETKRKPFYLPWVDETTTITSSRNSGEEQKLKEKEQNLIASSSTSQTPQDNNSISLASAAKTALAQWVPLYQNPQIRSVMIMNAFYWFALAGAQMTLLPLILTSPSSGLNMTASEVGQVYMVMSLVQVMSNPIMARYLVDRIGKAPAIAGGCAVIATSMTCLPLFTDGEHWSWFVGTLGFWALGSSMLSTAPLAYISDKVDEDKRAQAIAMLRTSGDIGFLFGASCIGGLADFAGSLDLAMQSSGGFLSAATLWFIVRQSMLQNDRGMGVGSSTRIAGRKVDEGKEE